ncbi:MAG TPA: ferredoxin family protein [Dissulfurispiraceae bacterium]|nr:ferredoxin family protein [Dissulfurispiraceae bacterium]
MKANERQNLEMKGTATKKKKSSGMIVIDRELCKGCGYCINACPKGCIVQEDSFNSNGYYPVAFVNNNQCTGCAICACCCPDIAIEVWKEEQQG